uniref:RNA-editing substrate-binding complex 6 protein domain-containing protein n=1 Tax=Chromera velia CCMP2878 TaxID=1169474 RepID=A0A0G4IDW0_9ALVE|eukprot:Cvel_13549.t1-p1 / transcript=Cvel_13549.t1 / gene=Cvel_13549 / organism=Chromera_velia_CCMP2878 / gene_product=hypothetical protein / transcript_product=hypothetical protein / location=Cvel_scaffold930:50876-58018(+) / protein_length=1283 / sequence_SO=supercontig / SO=protein_coding / is_pseudo=false
MRTALTRKSLPFTSTCRLLPACRHKKTRAPDDFDVAEKMKNPIWFPAESFCKVPVKHQTASELVVTIDVAAKYQKGNANFWKQCTRAVLDLANSFTAGELTKIVNGYAKAQFRDHALFLPLAKYIALKATELRSSEMALVVNAYARVEVVHEPLFDVLAQDIPHRFVDLGPRGVAMIAQAYAKLGIYKKQLFNAIALFFADKYARFSPQDFAQMLWSFCQLKIESTSVVNVCSEHLLQKMDSMMVSEVLLCTDCLSRMGCDNRELVQALEQYFGQRHIEMPANAFPHLLAAFSRFPSSATSPTLYRRLGMAALRSAHELHPKAIAQMVEHLRSAGYSDALLEEAAESLLPQKLGAAPVSARLELLDSYVSFENRDELMLSSLLKSLRLFGDDLLRDRTRLTDDEFGRLAGAFAALGWQHGVSECLLALDWGQTEDTEGRAGGGGDCWDPWERWWRRGGMGSAGGSDGGGEGAGNGGMGVRNFGGDSAGVTPDCSRITPDGIIRPFQHLSRKDGAMNGREWMEGPFLLLLHHAVKQTFPSKDAFLNFHIENAQRKAEIVSKADAAPQGSFSLQESFREARALKGNGWSEQQSTATATGTYERREAKRRERAKAEEYEQARGSSKPSKLSLRETYHGGEGAGRGEKGRTLGRWGLSVYPGEAAVASEWGHERLQEDGGELAREGASRRPSGRRQRGRGRRRSRMEIEGGEEEQGGGERVDMFFHLEGDAALQTEIVKMGPETSMEEVKRVTSQDSGSTLMETGECVTDLELPSEAPGLAVETEGQRANSGSQREQEQSETASGQRGSRAWESCLSTPLHVLSRQYDAVDRILLEAPADVLVEAILAFPLHQGRGKWQSILAGGAALEASPRLLSALLLNLVKLRDRIQASDPADVELQQYRQARGVRDGVGVVDQSAGLGVDVDDVGGLFRLIVDVLLSHEGPTGGFPSAHISKSHSECITPDANETEAARDGEREIDSTFESVEEKEKETGIDRLGLLRASDVSTAARALMLFGEREFSEEPLELLAARLVEVDLLSRGLEDTQTGNMRRPPPPRGKEVARCLQAFVHLRLAPPVQLCKLLGKTCDDLNARDFLTALELLRAGARLRLQSSSVETASASSFEEERLRLAGALRFNEASLGYLGSVASTKIRQLLSWTRQMHFERVCADLGIDCGDAVDALEKEKSGAFIVGGLGFLPSAGNLKVTGAATPPDPFQASLQEVRDGLNRGALSEVLHGDRSCEEARPGAFGGPADEGEGWEANDLGAVTEGEELVGEESQSREAMA